MYWPLLTLLLLLPAQARANTTVTCPLSLTFNNEGQLTSSLSGKCPLSSLMLQSGGSIRLQTGGRLLCQGSC